MNATMSTLAALCLLVFSTGVLTLNTGISSPEEWSPELQQACEAHNRLEDLGAVTQERLEQKARLITRLMEGEFSLVEAALWFRYYHRTTDDRLKVHLESVPGDTVDEKLCYQVISWVRSASRDYGASEAGEIESRLLCELAHLRQLGNGRVILPDQ